MKQIKWFCDFCKRQLKEYEDPDLRLEIIDRQSKILEYGFDIYENCVKKIVSLEGSFSQ